MHWKYCIKYFKLMHSLINRVIFPIQYYKGRNEPHMNPANTGRDCEARSMFGESQGNIRLILILLCSKHRSFSDSLAP
jgi:hypothetical protein